MKQRFSPKVILIIFGVAVFFFILISSVMVHELIHAFMDGFVNHEEICFFGWNELVGAPLNIAGWYDSSTVVSEVPAYIISYIYAIALLVLAWFGFARVYREL